MKERGKKTVYKYHVAGLKLEKTPKWDITRTNHSDILFPTQRRVYFRRMRWYICTPTYTWPQHVFKIMFEKLGARKRQSEIERQREFLISYHFFSRLASSLLAPLFVVLVFPFRRMRSLHGLHARCTRLLTMLSYVELPCWCRRRFVKWKKKEERKTC